MHPDFKTYCLSKKIDPVLFQKNEPKLYTDLERIFEQMHPNSFTAQKLYLINELRRRYTSTLEVKPVAKSKSEAPKPKVGLPKPGIKKTTTASKPILPKPAGMPKPVIPSKKERTEENSTTPTAPKPALKPVIRKPKSEENQKKPLANPVLPTAALSPKIPTPAPKEDPTKRVSKPILKPKIPPKP